MALHRKIDSGDMSIGQNSDKRADAAAEHTKQYTKGSIVKYQRDVERKTNHEL